MPPPASSSKRYQVVYSDRFQAAWDAGIAAGWLDPIAHRANLDFYTRVALARSPLTGEGVPDAGANVFGWRFPATSRSLTFIEIIYSVIEDDLIVILQDIALLPGADYEGHDSNAS